MSTDWRTDTSGRDYVYFAHLGDYVKVGYSYDPESRVDWILRTGGGVAWPRYLFPRTATFHSIHAVPGGLSVEREAHAALADFRECGEWFIAEHALLEWIPKQTGRPFKRLVREGGHWERPPTAQEIAEQATLQVALDHLFDKVPGFPKLADLAADPSP